MSIYSYRGTKSQKQSLHKHRLGLSKICGNDVATLLWASVALLFIAVNLVSSRPGSKKLKTNKLQSELTVQRALGKQFASKFGKSLKPNSQLLFINFVKGENDQKFHNAIVEGFETISKKMNTSLNEEIVTFTQLAPIEEARRTHELNITANQFDELIDKHPNCSAIISLVGIPDDYESSRTWSKVNNGEILLGIVADDVFLLGGMILNSEINLCIVPKRQYRFDRTFSDLDNADKIFTSRFHYISAVNIINVMRQEQRLFQVARRI